MRLVDLLRVRLAPDSHVPSAKVISRPPSQCLPVTTVIQPFHSHAAMSHIVKRKADELDDSDEEEEPMLGRQVLPVANLPDTFDGVPADGMQYLFTVR